MVPQSGGRGVAQTGGDRGPQCYAFPGRPEVEASNAVITGIYPSLSSINICII